MLRAIVIVLVGCSSRHPAPAWTGPEVDKACIEHARRGDLLATLPAEVGGFRVTMKPEEGRVILARDGRTLDDAAARDIYERAIGSRIGMYRIDSGAAICERPPGTPCFGATLHLCETSVATLAGWLADAARAANAGDAALGLSFFAVETAGPKCKQGAACTPRRHYGTKRRYDAALPRIPLRDHSHGIGECTDDGECEPDGNYCAAWYFGGFAQTLEYVEADDGTFCGCIERRCNWFTQ